MLTKNQFAYSIIQNFVMEYNKHLEVGKPRLEVTDYKRLESLIYQSSILTVALMHLGKLTDPSTIRYALERDGCMFIYTPIDIEAVKEGLDTPAILSAKEIMNLLPDD